MAKLGGKGLFDTKIEKSRGKNLMGRPKIHGDDVEKVTLTLDKASVDALDSISLSIRKNKRKVVDRGSIVRAMLKVCLSINVDFSSCESQTEIEERIRGLVYKQTNGLISI